MCNIVVVVFARSGINSCNLSCKESIDPKRRLSSLSKTTTTTTTTGNRLQVTTTNKTIFVVINEQWWWVDFLTSTTTTTTTATETTSACMSLWYLVLANFKRAYLHTHTIRFIHIKKNLEFLIFTKFYYVRKGRVPKSQSDKSLPGSYSLYLLTHHTINKIPLSPIPYLLSYIIILRKCLLRFQQSLSQRISLTKLL